MSRSFVINLTSISQLVESMVPSSADNVLQNGRISQSGTSTINICDVVNIVAMQHARVSDPLHPTILSLLVLKKSPYEYSLSRTQTFFGCGFKIIIEALRE